MADVREAIKTSFEDFGVVFDKDVINKCAELYIDHCFEDVEELVDSWMAFSVSHLHGANPTAQHLVRFERELLAQKAKKSAVIDSTPSETLTAYGSTPQRKTRTPDGIRSRSRLVSPKEGFSPVSFSPAATTPSARYASRHNAGSVLCERPGIEDESPEMSTVSVRCVSKPPREAYMSFCLTDYADAVEKHISCVVSELSARYNLDEIVPVESKHPTAVVTAGRIICDADGKLNVESLLLEASPESGGEVVKLDLSSLSSYSVFPGQVVAVEGFNVSGTKFVAQKIWTDASPVLPPPSITLPGSVKIIVACGPFTPSDSITYQPLSDLMEVVQREKPHLLLLTGPFIDADHVSFKEHNMAETYDEFFIRICDQIVEPLSGSRTKVVMVSSHRDICGPAVFPTPPHEFSKRSDMPTFLPDPCVIDVEGIKIGVTSVDVLMHLGKEEVAWPSHSGDRLARLASHILQQQSFYPLRPTAAGLPLDPTNESHLRLETNSHILILPSDLRCFIKDVNQTTIVNPEHLAKGLVGGSYGKLIISSNGSVSGQILKI